MSLTFKKFGYTVKSPETDQNINGFRNSNLQTQKKLLEAYNQPLPTLDEIASFEQQTNIQLPKDYSNFLLTVNGGYPSYYYIPTIASTVDHFYPFNCPFQTSSMNDLLILNKKDFFKDGRYHYLPIACTLAGDEYLMALKDDGTYPIYLYNYSDLCLLDFDESKLVFVADSFSIFLNLLVPYEKAQKL
ncbi:SMI1/KNR4 family protein [Entomomonas asaccharolytica]|uniref:SMI1/KNR4 family protein n=1 Tax=Entomomonas asaccharolytica TaxID=2785331 RepID=A0A974NI39_9GAMM|nr:SMI1/KNR4 family protein [Entomomonas asaccharolytica]QQP87010.1 SMI1/KNR4 family protein [Entomomonas asaccharolytica]